MKTFLNCFMGFWFYSPIISFIMMIGYAETSIAMTGIWLLIFGVNVWTTSQIWKNSTTEMQYSFTGANLIKKHFGIDILEDE